MRIVVQMLVRNEVDIIQECLAEIAKWGLTEIVILDGASDDGTTEAIRAFDGADIHLVSEPDPDGKFHDHLRNRLMNLTLQHNPDWILSLDADEIYHTNPVDYIEAADVRGCNVVRSLVPQFWITVDDVRSGILTEDRRRSIQDRRRWYSWGHIGTFIWRVHPDHYYPLGVPMRTPELPGQTWRDWQIPLNNFPICKHYCFRTLEQGMRRAQERRTRGGRRYFGKYFHNWIIDEVAVPLWHYDGDIHDQQYPWNPHENHRAVHTYMGGGR